MDINEAFEFTLSLARQGREGRLRPDQWNTYAGLAQMAAITAVLPYIEQPEMRELILPLQTISDIPTKSGVALLPKDVLQLEAAATAYAPNLDILSPSEFSERKRSHLVGPELEYPIAMRAAAALSVLPLEVDTVSITYFRHPKKPNWDYNIVGGEPVHNTSATPGVTGKPDQDFEVSEKLHEQICARIVLIAGFQLSNAELVQYGLQMNK